MFKFLDNHHINLMKKKLSEVIKIKKLLMSNYIERFETHNLSLTEAIKVYFDLKEISFKFTSLNETEELMSIFEEKAYQEDFNKDDFLKFKTLYTKELSDLEFLLENKKNGNIDKFSNAEMSLDDGMNFYKKLTNLKSNFYDYGLIENKEDSLIEIMIKNNYGDENFYDSLHEITFNTQRCFNQDEYDRKVDDMSYGNDTSEIFFESIIEYVCEKSNIKLKTSSMLDILISDNSKEFNDVKKEFEYVLEYYIEDNDEEEGFMENMPEDCNVFLFENLAFDETDFENINSSVSTYGYEGFSTESYMLGDNAYLDVSQHIYFEPLETEFVLSIICALYLGGKK